MVISTKLAAKEMMRLIEEKVDALGMALIEDKEVIALLDDLRTEVGISVSAHVSKFGDKSGWMVNLSFPEIVEPGRIAMLFSGKRLHAQRDAQARNHLAVKRYFGIEPRVVGYDNDKYYASISILDILTGATEGLIPALVAKRYAAQLFEIRSLCAKVVCPYIGVCSDRCGKNDERLYPCGCSYWVAGCKHITSHYVLTDSGLQESEWWG
jgi:hypothetical protein